MAWTKTRKGNIDHLTCSERILRVNRRNLVQSSKLKLQCNHYDKQCSRKVAKISSEIYEIYFEEQLPREREMVERGLLEHRARRIPKKNSGRRPGLAAGVMDETERHVERMTREFENWLRQSSLPEESIKRDVRRLLRSDIDTVMKASEAFNDASSTHKPSAPPSPNVSRRTSIVSNQSERSGEEEREEGPDLSSRPSIFLPAVTVRRPSYVPEREETGFLGKWRPNAFRMRTPRILHADWVNEKRSKERRAEQSQRSYQQLIQKLTTQNEKEIEKLYSDEYQTTASVLS